MLHGPLTEKKRKAMKEEEWDLLDRQTLGVTWLSLVKKVSYTIVNVKTTYNLM